jgi:protein gp37
MRGFPSDVRPIAGDVAREHHDGIEWTDATWNPVTGCTKVSPACAHCYIERTPPFRIAGRHFVRGAIPIICHADRLGHPLAWRTPRRVFVNSLSDLFHEAIPLPFLHAVFATMCRARQHQFQVLTKRAARLAALAPSLPWPANVWMGVSVENARFLDRVARLRTVPAQVRLLSLEPLLGPLPHLPLDGVHWVIVGGESGPVRRRTDPAWVRDIRDQCRAAGVAFFFKQWGGQTAKAGGRALDGRTWDEMPAPEDRS